MLAHHAVVVHAQHAAPAAPAVVRARRLVPLALGAVPAQYPAQYPTQYLAQ